MAPTNGLKYGKSWLTIGIVIAVVIVIVLVVQYFFRPSASTEHRATAPVVTQSVHPDNLTVIRHDFGPWQIIGQPHSSQILLLMQNGSVEQGSKTFRPDNSWRPSFVPEFRDIVRTGNTLHVRSTTGELYTILAGQAFVLEARPETVYAFTHDTQVVAVPSAALDKKER
jgi:hypothetical protein